MDLRKAHPVLAPLLQGKEIGRKPATEDLSPAIKKSRRLLQIWGQLAVVDGVLCHLQLPGTGIGATALAQQVISSSLQNEVLKLLHEGVGGGHLGAEKTLSCLKERFYWPGHYADVPDWCYSCTVCSSHKDSPTKCRAPLQNVEAGYPLQMVATDIMGPFPQTAAENTHILVISDYFTRWVEAYPIPNLEATTVAKKLIFLRFGAPEQLHADQGQNFESNVITELCKMLGIIKTRTTPYHPQSDGLVERLNRALLNMLALATADHQTSWEDHLQGLCLAYNTSVHPTTGHMQFFLTFGRQARLPVDIIFRSPTPTPDLVLGLIPTSVNKLLAEWRVPYPITRRVGEVVYEVDMK